MQKQLRLLAFIFTIIPAFALRAEGLSAYADLLVWQASEAASSTWATTISSGSTTGARSIDIDETRIDFDWSTGFRGGLGYQTTNQTWNTNLYWTYFNTDANNNMRMTSQIIVPEFFSGFLSGNFFFGGSIDWDIKLNSIDWDLGHKFIIGDAFTFRPAIGIKGAEIKQSINCTWEADIYTSTEYVTNNFKGIGPSVMLDTGWQLYKNKHNSFNLIGDFAAALMWGKWNINDVYYRPTATLVTQTTITTSMSDSKLGTMMFDYILGLEWIYESNFRFSFKIGYEMQVWANQLRLTTFQQLPERGDLTLQGGTCGIRIEL